MFPFDPLDADLALIEPSDADLEVAAECLAPIPWTSSPRLHVGRIIARYRLRLEGATRPEAMVGGSP